MTKAKVKKVMLPTVANAGLHYDLCQLVSLINRNE